jgi:Tol biopolymer transport system component
LGTAAYMSPEQAKGKAVDKRADIWAFGCILYECLTGKRAFEGETVTETLAAVLKGSPDWEALPAATSPNILFVLRRCLEKNLKQRFHDAADVRIQISEAGVIDEAVSPVRRSWLAWSIAGGLAVVAALALWAPWRSTQQAPEVTRSLINVLPADQLQASPADQRLSGGHLSVSAIALSPDGRTIVFSAVKNGSQQLYARRMDQLEAIPLADTNGAACPFISPDGKWIGFWAEGGLKKILLEGNESAATTLCKTSPICGASWGSDNAIVFAHFRGGLWKVPAAGGNPKSITKLDATRGELSHRLPQILPGNNAVIFTITHSMLPTWDDTEIAVQSLITNERKILVERGADGRYVSPGHLIYLRRGTLIASLFNLKTLAVSEGGSSLINGVMQSANMITSGLDTGSGQFSISDSGSLAYVPGGIFSMPERLLAWVDRNGNTEALSAPPRPYVYPRLSPDGKQILLSTQGDRNIWVYDISGGGAKRLTVDGRSMAATWAPPDGKRVIFGSSMWGNENLFSIPADGSGFSERLTTSSNSQRAAFVSSDGELLLFVQNSHEIWSLPLAGSRHPELVSQTHFDESCPELSFDKHWLAYASNESGRFEVYVREYPRGGKMLISTDGGTAPSWRKDGKELFYVAQIVSNGLPQTAMMAVTINTRPTFTKEKPRILFQSDGLGLNAVVRGYDVTPDGRRFLIVQTKSQRLIKPAEIVLVQNWLEELKRRAPAK